MIWNNSHSTFLIDGSTLVSKYNCAIYTNGAPHFTINNSQVAAGAGEGVFDVHNANPIIDLKGNSVLSVGVTEYFPEITSKPKASIRMRGGDANWHSPIITLYDSAKLTPGSQSHIYYTNNGNRTQKYVRFADNYVGSPAIAISAVASGGHIYFYDSLEAALTSGWAVVQVTRDLTFDAAVPVKNNATLQSAVIVDADTGNILPGRVCTITSSADAFTLTGDITVKVEFLNIKATGNAFVYDGTSANTSITLNHVTLTAGTEYTGKLDTNTFTKATPYVAKVGYVGFTTFQAALADVQRNREVGLSCALPSEEAGRYID